MFPTAPKLIAALVFAALAWWVCDLVRPYLPEQQPARGLNEVAAGFGLLMGWRVMGRLVGGGYVAAMGYGLTTLVAVVLWTLLALAGYEMVERAVRLFYDGPMEAIEAMVLLMIGYGSFLLNATPAVSAAVGAALCGVLVEFVARRAA